MKTTGKFLSAGLDYQTKKFNITFSLDYKPGDEELERLRCAETLDITASKHSKKRSLTANAYFHVLVGKIANCVRSSDVEVKNRLIREYGEWMYINDTIPTYAVKEDMVEAMLKMEGIHWVVIDRVDVEDGRVALGLKRGSHTYNSKEMARLIDGTVQEAKDLGIETLPPAELERMLAAVDKK